MIDNCNDPSLRSFIDVPADSPFPIQNLPFGVFVKSENEGDYVSTVGFAIGDWILDLGEIIQARLLAPSLQDQLFTPPWDLAYLMAMERADWRSLRLGISKLLRRDNPTLRDNSELRAKALVRRRDARMLLPCRIPNYTDFYSSREHATNVGIMLRGPDNALMPNWLHLPVAYHGRASSVVVNGTDIRRPLGQTKADDAAAPTFGPSRSLDFELELGALIGRGNQLGTPISTGNAAEHVFGLVLVNDWSARDIQKWEYQPLGPFLSKNFATSISPWVVTLDALEPFRVAGPKQEPEPLPYLRCQGNWAYDIHLEIWLQTAKMTEPVRISATNAKHLYWNLCQQIAHHTIGGCNLQTGDLLASGTISGPTPDSLGSMLELAWKGTRPITLPSGETRTFLQDGDRVMIKGWCQGDGYRVGFGEVTGVVLPALV
ncbi:MAG: fumarylacetoacetase [Planctomycetes bacterium]|jgi:fumarylacetoacetase|nr:fumarylacetoacetase [Planctomycetota bacterium]